MSLRILLVRHGLSSFNLEHRIQGRDDLSTLTETGVQQALATGEALRGLAIDAAYSSPLRRAHDTARPCWRPRVQRCSPGATTTCSRLTSAPGPG